MTIAELAPRIRARRLSPVDLVREYLDRIARLNPQLKAYLTVTADHALAQARTAEAEIARGRYRGPLHGIPYAVKDLIATKGIRTTNGSRVTENWIPDADAAVVERLTRAGAVLLGKLNLLEFAMGSGQRGLDGPARNPWDLRYSPSGSSSGSGAAVAANLAVFTIGSDTGGSIRGPAKSCGVTGLKPTFGWIPLDGVTTLSWTLDTAGPLTRTAADMADVLRAVAGPVPEIGGGVKGLRIGIAPPYFWNHVQPEVERALRAAIEVFRGLGAVPADVTFKDPQMCGPVSSMILSSEAAAFHGRRLKEHADKMDPLVRERLEAATFNTAVDYIHAQRVRTLLMEETRRLFTTCDVLLLPAGNPAPLLEQEIVTTDLPPDPPPPKRPDVANLANVTGIPSLVFPCGFTDGPPVLPIGLQLCGRPGAEAVLLRAAHAYQRATDWHTRRAPLS